MNGLHFNHTQYVYGSVLSVLCVLCMCWFSFRTLCSFDTLLNHVLVYMFVCIVAYGCIADLWMVTVDPKWKIRRRTFHCYFNQENSHLLTTLTRCIVFVACKNIIFNISKLNKQILLLFLFWNQTDLQHVVQKLIWL